MRQKLCAEFIGTFAIVFFGCGSIMLDSDMTPLIFGMAVATMIYTVGHISGAHFNPAVTIAFSITRHFPAKHILPYGLAQCIGGIAASAALSYLFPALYGFGTTIPRGYVNANLAFAWEAVLSFFLMFVIMAVATDTRAEGMMAGIAIGSIVALAAFVGGPFTGASMNPARTLGPAVLSGNYDALWVYFSAPFLGAALGATAYQLIRCDGRKNDAKGCC